MAELLALCRTGDWVTEEPEQHLLPRLANARVDGLTVAGWRVTPDGVLELDLAAAGEPSYRELRRGVWSLLGTVAEPSTVVRERSGPDELVFEVVTGVPVGAGPFTTHGHTLRLRLPRPT